MKVVAFNGSARKDDNTAILIKQVFKELEKEGIAPVGTKEKKPKDERKENRGGGRHGKRTKISENEVQSDYDENKLYGK